MRRRVTEALGAACLLASGLLVGSIGHASTAAADDCEVVGQEQKVIRDPNGNVIKTELVDIVECGGINQTGTEQAADSGTGKPSVVQQEITDYCKPLPLPSSHPVWKGHDPAQESLLTCEGGVIGCGPSGPWGCIIFVPNGEAPGIVVDPRVLAQQARDQLPLETANAHIAPPPTFHTYVHIDNWMWLDEGQWRELAQTVSLARTSVTVTAEPTRVEWDMGHETVMCPDGGRPWVDGMSDAAKTTCSHAYDTISNPEGDTHPVSARIVYSITWTCSGVCTVQGGDFGLVPAPAGETTTIEVRQRQTVNTP